MRVVPHAEWQGASRERTRGGIPGRVLRQDDDGLQERSAEERRPEEGQYESDDRVRKSDDR